MIQTKVVQKIKTHFLCSVIVFANRTVYETMWKHMSQTDKSRDNTKRRMRISWWMTKAADTQAESFFFPHGNNRYANAPDCYFYT